jgi:hypothetical protein
MTMTRPFRRIILHFSHILLTDGRTFMPNAPGTRGPHAHLSGLQTRMGPSGAKEQV